MGHSVDFVSLYLESEKQNLSLLFFEECSNIMNNIEKFVIDTLTKNLKYIKLIAKSLIKYETIDYNTIKKIVPNKLENSLNINL